MSDTAAPTTAALDALENETPGAAALTITVREQSFRLVKEVPAIVMLRLSAAGDDKTPPARQMAAIVTFLEKVIVDDDRDAFMALLEDAEPVINFEELSSILEAATEVLAGRPTSP
jgi:hypothetical protein